MYLKNIDTELLTGIEYVYIGQQVGVDTREHNPEDIYYVTAMDVPDVPETNLVDLETSQYLYDNINRYCGQSRPE